MASSSDAVLKVGGFLLDVLAEKLKHDDLTDEQTRQLIMKDLKKVKESLDVLRHKEFNTAKHQIQQALELYSQNRISVAEKEFEKPRDKAETAFHVVPNIKDKLESIKIAGRIK